MKKALIVVVLVAGVVSWGYLRVEAYGGDVSCLFAKCVKLK